MFHQHLIVMFSVLSDAARIVNDETEATKQLVNPFATKHSVPSDLVALAQEVNRADESVRSMAGGKLQIIAEQIRFLQEQVILCVLVKNPNNYGNF